MPQVINLLSKLEFDQFKTGHMIQLFGNNPLVAFEGARMPRQQPVIEATGQAPVRGAFQCSYCAKVCSTRQALGGHVAAHRRHRDRKLLTHVSAK